MIKRPVSWLLAAYLLGLAGWRISFSAMLFCLGILLCFSMWMLKRNKQQYFILLLPFLFLLGHIGMKKQQTPAPLDLFFQEKISAQITGRVSTIEEKENNQTILLKKCSVLINHSKKQHRVSSILIYFPKNNPIKTGDIIQVKGTLCKFTKPANHGQFDEYLYHKIRKEDYKCFADSFFVKKSNTHSYLQYLYSIKKQIHKVYDTVLPKKESAVLYAMLLGEKDFLDKEIKYLYQKNGIAHILAISGLHVSFFGIFFYGLLKKIGVPVLLNTVINTIFLFSFGMLTNFSVSTNRAVVMLLISLFAGVLRRTYDRKSSICISAFLILIQRPMEIYNAGFLLSYGAVCSVAYILPVLKKHKDIIWDKCKKRILEREGTLKKSISFTIASKISDTFIVSGAIMLVTLPVLLSNFYEISPYSILLNMLVLPLMSIIILLSFFCGITGLLCIPAAKFLAGSVYILLNFYEVLCRIFVKLPLSTICTGCPDRKKIIIYFICLSGLVIILEKYKKTGHLLLLFLLPLLFLKIPDSLLRVTFLDIGQGDSILVETPDNRTYLIDGGSSNVKESGKYRIEPLLKYKGIRAIDYVVITHMDEDHISGIRELLERKMEELPKIRNLLLTDIGNKDKKFREIEKMAKDSGIKISYIKSGQYIRDKKILVKCLHPPEGFKAESKNETSAVLQINYKKFSLLLTGDLEGEGERRLLHSNLLNRTTILKVAHHGSQNSTTTDFLNRVRPEYAVISCGKGNHYGHPHRELLERLKKYNCKVFLTMEKGEIGVISDGQNMKINSFSGEP